MQRRRRQTSFLNYSEFVFEKSRPASSKRIRAGKVKEMDRPEKRPSLDELVHAHLSRTLRFAIRLTGDRETAEEIVQESLLRAARGWKSFRGESEFRTWLFRIVINVFRDRQRARHARPCSLPAHLQNPGQLSPPDVAINRELGRLVASRISALPPRQREVLVLTAFEGLTLREVAATLAISEANVHSTLHVARQRLKRELAPYLVEK